MSDDKSKERDPELDDLLDSALEDMTKKPTAASAAPSGEVVPGSEAGPNLWSEEFIKEAAAQFETNMAALLGGFSGAPEEKLSQEQIAQTFSKMAEAAAQILKPAEGAPAADPEDDAVVKQKADEVSAAISQTLQNLNTNSESLQNPFNDQDLANMFGNFSLNDGQENNMFLPFMQGMMQSLLSKEVLYPSLKDLLDKYPEWLEKNKGVIPQADYERYEQQKQLMEKVCAELEPESETDPDDVKNKRFQTVLELMQKMQDLGQPPTELVGDIAVPPTGFAPPPQDSSDPSQCTLM